MHSTATFEERGSLGEMSDELAATGAALSIDNPMGADEAGGDASVPGAAVSQADVEAALDLVSKELNGAGTKFTPEAKVALHAYTTAILDARVGPAGDLRATIKQAATEIVAHFSESPTNWCAFPLAPGAIAPHVRRCLAPPHAS